MKLILPLLALVAVTGCVSSIVPAGPNTYYVSKGPLPIWMSGTKAKAACYHKASAWCSARGLVMVPVASTAQDPSFGHSGSAELTFRALKPGDPAITNTAATVIP